MKKLLIIALFVLGMCNVSVFGMVQEIILTESYSIMPSDDANRETLGGRPEPNLFRASVDGNYFRYKFIKWRTFLLYQSKRIEQRSLLTRYTN